MVQSSSTRLGPWGGSISEAQGEKAVLSSPFRQDRLPGPQFLAVLLTASKREWGWISLTQLRIFQLCPRLLESAETFGLTLPTVVIVYLRN